MKHICGKQLSPKNVVLILQQRPAASMVGGRRQWFWAKRKVLDDAEPITIKAPILENGIVKQFIDVQVFDIEQTEKISIWAAIKGIVTPDRQPGEDDIDEKQAARDAAQREKNRKAAIKSIATALKNEAQANPLWKEIKQRGGLKPKNKDYEDYGKIVPLFIKKRSGLPLDEMASELGMDDTQLWAELLKAHSNKKANSLHTKAYWMALAESRYFHDNPGEEPIETSQAELDAVNF